MGIIRDDKRQQRRGNADKEVKVTVRREEQDKVRQK